MKDYKYVVVGAGLWGCTIAERIASVLKEPVMLIDHRNHIGGNCQTRIHPETGIEYGIYGCHTLHTSLEHVWQYVNQFSKFNNYRHSVYTQYQDKIYNYPMNLKSINDCYNINLKPYEVDRFISKESQKEGFDNPQNLEEKIISLIGRPLYEIFLKGYTYKQWKVDPKELSADIISKIPIRKNYETSYFCDTWEGQPISGYVNFFDKMVENPLIHVRLETAWEDIKESLDKDTRVFYSGPVDALFGYKLGQFEYRSLNFKLEVKEVRDWQGCAIMYHGDKEKSYHRIHEFKHLHPERIEIMNSSKTLICYESFSKEKIENAYQSIYAVPVNTASNRELYNQYLQMAKSQKNLILAGRLGSSDHYNMDKVIDNALSCFDSFYNFIK